MRSFDIAFIGQYTKDTIVNASGTQVKDGGAYYFGANVASRMGLKTAAVTSLAREDFPAPESLRALGVEVFVKESPKSTCLRLEYPSSNLDDRILTVTSVADPFRLADVAGIDAAVWSVGASIRGEVGLGRTQSPRGHGCQDRPGRPGLRADPPRRHHRPRFLARQGGYPQADGRPQGRHRGGRYPHG